VLVAVGTPQDLKRRITGGHARLYFGDRCQVGVATAVLAGASPDDDPLALRVPTDSSPADLIALLARVDQHSPGVERVTVHSPDLDDVFFTLTGHDRPGKESAA
jgi:ABC-2 type transport system ATP-binding protein